MLGGRVVRRKVVICGAAGRDFHNFNVVYRHAADVEVVAFTAAQIPGIEDRRVPAAIAGPLYPQGIPIWPESQLRQRCLEHAVQDVVFAYSDVTRGHVMAIAAEAFAAGAGFVLLGPDETMLPTTKPAIAVCAVRTGCGKSQVARYLAGQLHAQGQTVAVLRHPMPYGDLSKQTVQRFACMADLDAADCTVEEREEYEPHIAHGGIVFAGVDYQQILAAAEAEADFVLWDGGNNDHPFIQPDYNIVVVDALRPDHLDTHFPGDSVLLRADLVVVNKVHAASPRQLQTVQAELDRCVPAVPRVFAASPVRLDDPERLTGASVLIIEDGPTITHGGMPHGAGYQAVKDLPVAEIVDPRPFAVPDIAAVFERYPHIGPVLPAMGYSAEQRRALAATIERAQVDFVVSGSPVDLSHALQLQQPVVRVYYDYQEAGVAGAAPLMSYIEQRFAEQLKAGHARA